MSAGSGSGGIGQPSSSTSGVRTVATAGVTEASSALEMSPPPHPANKADEAANTAK